MMALLRQPPPPPPPPPPPKGAAAGRGPDGAMAGDERDLAALEAALGASPTLHPSGLRGLAVVEDFITEGEEAALLQCLDSEADGAPWRERDFNGKAYGKAWGVRTNLATRKMSPPAVPMPAPLLPIIERMRTQVPLLRGFTPNEANAIDYRRRRGHSLTAHCDDRQLSGAILVNLCLAGSAVMTYSRDTSAAAQRHSVRVELPRRGLQVQSGVVRYNYSHAIANGDLLGDRRVSITFRQNVWDGGFC